MMITIFARVPDIFNQPTKKNKKWGGKLEKPLRRTVVPGICITSRTLWTTTNKTGGGAGCKRPRQRGTDGSFTCVLLRSCRDARRRRHLSNARRRHHTPPHVRMNKLRVGWKFCTSMTHVVCNNTQLAYSRQCKKSYPGIFFCFLT